MKWLVAFALIAVTVPTLHASQSCDLSHDGLMKYEQRILTAADLFKKQHNSRQLLKITEPLACLLEMQERGEGDLKLFANSFLRPILGGAQTPGVPKDPRYKIIADELSKISNHVAHPLDSGVMAAHSRGAWKLYALFCEQGDVEFCTTFLPDQNRIEEESPLLASSSMLILRHAYHALTGKQKDEVAERIRQIYKTLPLDNSLKRKMIDQIYSELFPVPLSLNIS
jgi:hypothetical protein